LHTNAPSRSGHPASQTPRAAQPSSNRGGFEHALRLIVLALERQKFSFLRLKN
jgi:hypothetical protein